MKIEVNVFGFLKHRRAEKYKKYPVILRLEQSVALHYLIHSILKINESDAVVLVNGRYRLPDYYLQDGDTVSVFPPLAGG